MEKNNYIPIILLSLVIFGATVFSQTKAELDWLIKFADDQEKISTVQKITAESLATARKMPIRTEYSDGTIIELMRFENNHPVYYVTESNLNAAKTLSTDRVWPGGAGGFSLTGGTDTLGIWDGGKVRDTHQELIGRFISGDGAGSLSDHATHVAGTMIASGVNSNAKGMSYQAKIKGYEWTNDVSEMASAATYRLRVSNHSYGTITGWRFNYFNDNRWAWFGNPSISEVEDYTFGYYSSSALQWDNISRNAPYYLIVKSAGNDRGEGLSSAVEHWVYVSGQWVLRTSARDKDGGTTGYDCISYAGTAKNILTVGAVNIISSGYTGPSSVIMSSFSGWGPVDDGRIKPDIVGAGVSLYSSVATSDNAFATYSGTSMSSPNITGSIGLLLEHQRQLNGNIPLRSSTIKGLLLHTADEAGPFNGPDYIYGWGLMNTLKSAQLMEANKNSQNGFNIRELNLNNGDSLLIRIPAKGTQPIRATICWTDPAGTSPPISLDPPNLMLVNDIDLRIIFNDTTFFPWILDPSNPSVAATTGDNFRDNIEQILIQSPLSGLYTLKIKHKSSLSGGNQVVSLIISGGQNLLVQSPNGGENWQIGSTQRIKWIPSEFSGNAKIEITRDGGISYETIFASTSNDGYVDWVVTGPVTSSAKIRVSDVENILKLDQSTNFFSISEASLSLLSPSGGEIWYYDSIKTITWTSNNLPGKVKIELSRNGGLNYESIFDSADNDGNEDWVASPPVSELAKIRISSLYIPSLFDTSESNFTITGAYIFVLSPSQNFAIILDSLYEIKWRSNEAAEDVKIELSRDGGLTYETLLESTPNDGSKIWTATPPLTDKAKIRVSNANPPTLFGLSNGLFTIGVKQSVNYKAGWNLVSTPLKATENRKTFLFQSAETHTFGFTSGIGYEAQNTITCMKGYWLKYNENTIELFIGVPFLSDSMQVSMGWNLIGTVSSPVHISKISTTISGLFSGFIYGYDQKYYLADSLHPGKAYWVKVNNDGVIKIDDGAYSSKLIAVNNFQDNFNWIKFTDASGKSQKLFFTLDANNISDLSFYELPPMPPQPSFDVRFSTHRLFELFNQSQTDRKKIELQSLTYPISILWNIAQDNSKYQLANGSTVLAEMRGSGSTVVIDELENTITLKRISSIESQLPTETALLQNYPNPFNPVTNINYQLSNHNWVTLKVYDILGSEVVTLVNEYKEAGYYSVSFNSSTIKSNLPSGIYYYKLNAGTKVFINKMLLLK